MKKEIITEKRYSFELGGIRLKTGTIEKDSPIIISVTNEIGGGFQLNFTKQELKDFLSLFNELVLELEKEEEIKPETSPCSTCQNTSPDPFNITCVSCDETFSKYKGEEKEITEPILKGCDNCLNQNNQMDTSDCEKCCTSLLLGGKPYVELKEEVKEEPKQEIVEDIPEPITKVCRNCKHFQIPIPECNGRCNHSYDKWEPKE